MSKDEIDKCYYCDREASEVINNESICWECIDEEYFICPQTGDYCKIEDKKELDGEWYSPDGYDEIVVYCEWSGNEIHNDNAICVNGDYYVDRDYEDEISDCADCGHEGHCDDFSYNDYDNCTYCDDCYSEHNDRGPEWYGSFKMLNGIKPSNGTIGIEFETENCENGPNQSEVPYIAIAEHDGSLTHTGGLEYKTHIMKGKDVPETIDDFVQIIKERGMTVDDSTVGWHFHYGATNRHNGHIRNMVHSLADLGTMITDCEGFNYFRNMLRDYASPMTAPYKVALKGYKGKNHIGDHIRRTSNYPSRGTMVNLMRLFGHRSTFGDEERRFEVRLYCPRVFLQEHKKFCGEDADYRTKHEDLAEDYKNFISFWDEFFKKSAVRKMVLRDDNNELMNLDTFSKQFTPKVRNWLKSREMADVIPHPSLRSTSEYVNYDGYFRERQY